MGINITDYALFEGLGKKEVAHIESISTPISVAAGREIVTEGTRGRECFVVLDGTVGVDRHGERVAEIGAGGVVGEISLIDREQERTASVVALTDTDVLVFSAQEFNSLVAEHPAVTARIEQAAVKRLAADIRADETN